MLGDRYTVVRGDNLWRIAARTLGGGAQWPRIWKYNNRKEVVRITGRALPDPDFIKIGQVLLIPRLPTPVVRPIVEDEDSGGHLPTAVEPHVSKQQQQPSAASAASSERGSLSSATRGAISKVSFKYRGKDLRWPPQDVGTAIIEVRMTGDVLLMTKQAYPATFITSRGEVELQLTSAANHAFGALVSDTRVVFDPLQNTVTLRSMLVSQSKTPNLPATALGVEMGSLSPVPKLRAEMRLPKKTVGSIGVFDYAAVDVKFVVEVTPKRNSPPSPPSLRPERAPLPTQATHPSNGWATWIGAGLVLTAVGIVVATVVEDYLTVGVGVADDPESMAAAGAALARGLAALGIAGAGKLPEAGRPAHVIATTTLSVRPGQ